MTLSFHVAMLVILTIGIGWMMMKAGLQKSALERRHTQRICPACGRELHGRLCPHCSH